MDQDDQHPQHPHTLQLVTGQGSPPRTPREQRRAMLWRERMKLEFQVQGLFVRAAVLVQAWQSLHGSKAALEHEVPQMASRMVLAGLAGIPQLAFAWHYYNEQDRIVQEEQRMQRDMLRCSADIAVLQAQITVLDFELALL
jgi:hypothetical protein